MSDKIFDRRVYYPGQCVFSQGNQGHCMYYVERGRVLIARGEESNPEKIGEVITGGIFGEMALVDGAPRMAHATAIEESVLHSIPKKMFDQKFDKADPFIKAVLRILIVNARSAHERADSMRKLVPVAAPKQEIAA
jgi:CRP-like cAMP-binding protein